MCVCEVMQVLRKNLRSHFQNHKDHLTIITSLYRLTIKQDICYPNLLFKIYYQFFVIMGI